MINQEKLLKSIANAVLKTLYESEETSYDDFSIVKYSKNSQEDRFFVNENKQKILNFFNEGYLYSLGKTYEGCHNEKSLYKNFDELKIAYHNETPIAMSIYSSYLGGHKCVGITTTTVDSLRPLGVQAVKEIIKTDISLYKEFYWIECSDAVEHLYIKNGGIMIPSEYAEFFIGNKFVIDKLDDGFHYYRQLPSGETVKKMIFGFNSKDTYDKIMSYENQIIIDSINKLNSSIYGVNESVKKLYTIDEAAYMKIIVFFDAWNSGLNEYPEGLLNILENEVKTLEKYIEEHPDENKEKLEKYELMIENGYDILNSCTTMELHVFK